MPTIDNWRSTLMRAAINCQHRITSEMVCLESQDNALAQLADRLGEAVKPLLDERDRLATDRAVLIGWIKEAMPWIQGQQSLYPNHELGALCESGRRLVDGGPDDLLKDA